MALLPILDPLQNPREGTWYSLIPRGNNPDVSVGHTCIYKAAEDGGKGKVFIVGGANPNGSFSHSHIINLDNHEWDIPEWSGLKARYEHCCFVPESFPQSLWVFGGAQQSGNRNCVQNIQIKDSKSSWENVSTYGKIPCPRTYHTSSACLGDKLYVFGGGEAGVTPVSDPKLHVFDTVSHSWTQPATQGRHPPVRHGHIIVAVDHKIYIHGGLAGDKFYKDMFCLDTRRMKWEKLQSKGDVPPGTASHSAIVQGTNIFIFGGMTADGASNSMYKFMTGKSQWMLMKFEGDLPPNRLDHCMCVLPWKMFRDEDKAEGSLTSPQTVNLAFVFGGMDTQGIIHNDCIVTVIT